MNKPAVIIGDGWAALGAAAESVLAGANTIWISGTGSRMIAPLPSIECGSGFRGAAEWGFLARSFGIETGGYQTGSFLREFRNKSFREPAWTQAATSENRASILEEYLWAPERALVPLFEGRFGATFQELEELLREKLLGGEFPFLERREAMPVTSLEFTEGRVSAVVLGSGERIESDRVIFADSWGQLHRIQGLPKPLGFARRLHPVSLLQAAFSHEVPVGQGLPEAFFGPLHRESGEDFDRNAWGYFSSDGRRSFWTLCLSGEEVEDNHAIAKRLRRLKSALDKMFTGETWVPAGKTEFMANVAAVKGEQVRFEEAVLFADGKPSRAPATLPAHEGLFFLTDGYGPSCALHQVAALFGRLEGLGTEPEAENVDSEIPVIL